MASVIVLNVVVCAAVQFGEDGGSSQQFQGDWDEGKTVPEPDSDPIEGVEVNAGPQASFFAMRLKQQGTWMVRYSLV